MSNGGLVARASPGAVPVSVYPLPARSMLRLRKVATPATAGTVVVPERVPLAGLAPIAAVTSPVKLVARLPNPSRAVTSIWGAIVAFAVAVLGGTLNASCVAGPATTRNEVDVARRPSVVADSVYQASALSMVRFEKVATPPTAATVVSPERVAPAIPVPATIASVTFPAK